MEVESVYSSKIKHKDLTNIRKAKITVAAKTNNFPIFV